MSSSANTRSAKRRKIDNNATDAESNATPSGSPSVFRSLRSAVNDISKRLFDSATASASDATNDGTGTESYADDSIGGQSTAKQSSRGRNGPQDGASTPAKNGIDSQEQTPLSEEITVRTSGRQRKRPGRFSNELEEAPKAKRSVATPTKSTQTPRQKKEQIGISDPQTDSIGKELGFKDIDKSAKKKTGKAKKDVTIEQQRPHGEQDEKPQANTRVASRSPQITVNSDEMPPEAGLTQQTSKKKSKPTPDKVPASTVPEVGQDVPELSDLLVEVPPLLETSAASFDVSDDIVDVDEETRAAYDTIQQLILSRLTGRRRIPLVGLDEEFNKVRKIAEQTVVAGEGNSMLIIGPRGCGKTTLIETVVTDLRETHSRDFHVVRLNGFLQTDDRLALREIWRQLGREMDAEDDANKVNSYADTMASLLALLSHPEELSTTTDLDVTCKSIIFIVDEFDLFATHPRQTLLYNLFDIAQARKAPIAVFGLSTKVDVAEHLEKRVKSRFSHRYVYLSPAKSFSVFTEMCKSALSVHDSDMVSLDSASHELFSAQKTWNTHLETLLISSEVNRLLRYEFTLSKSLPTLFTSFLAAFASVPFLPSTFPTSRSLALSSSRLQAPESHLSCLPDLPSLTLSLLISAARLEPLLGTSQCNFNMAYHEYVSLCARSRLQSSAMTGGVGNAGGIRVWGREVTRRAWEELEQGGWIIPVSGGEGKLGWTGDGREERMYRVDVTLEDIEELCFHEDRESRLGKLEKSWCREF